MREVFLSTSSVEPHRRSEYWRELNSSLRDVSPVDDGGNSALEGSMKLRTFGTIAISTHAFSAQRWRCEWHHVARGNAEHYRLMLVLAGNGKGDFNNTNLACGPGDLFIVDSAQPYHMEVEAGQRLAMFIPRAALEKLVGRKNLHGLVLEHASPMNTLLRDYMIGLSKVAHHLPGDESIAASESLITLVAGGFSGLNADSVAQRRTGGRPFRQSVLDYINQHVADPDLDIERLTRRFCISRSHLYRLFEADGGIARVIRDKRLELAYRQLVAPSPKQRARSIKELAYDCGFSGAEPFIRAFKAKFGATPHTVLMEQTPRQSSGDDAARLGEDVRQIYALLHANGL
jgi:AraC-like DNA-binding protein